MYPAVTPFWIDTEYDAEHASDGRSRFGAYVRQHIDSFTECWNGAYEEDLPVHFAAAAWSVATGPIMVPGYVRYHPRILSASVERSYWDGSLVATVQLITPWPQELRESMRWMEATGRGWWHDWPVDDLGGRNYRYPVDDDISQRPFLMSRSQLCFTVPHGQLPQPPAARHASSELVDLARQSVAAVMVELNTAIGPGIQALETSATRCQ